MCLRVVEVHWRRDNRTLKYVVPQYGIGVQFEDADNVQSVPGLVQCGFWRESLLVHDVEVNEKVKRVRHPILQ